MEESDIRTITQKYIFKTFIVVIVLSIVCLLLLKSIFGSMDFDIKTSSLSHLTSLIKTKAILTLIGETLIFFLSSIFILNSTIKKYNVSKFKEEFFKKIVIFLIAFLAIIVITQLYNQSKTIKKAEHYIDVYEELDMTDYEIGNEKVVEVITDLRNFCIIYMFVYFIVNALGMALDIYIIKRKLDSV